MTDEPISTPDDEVDTPGFYYPPFKEGWNYEGATYAGHSDYSVDWNRRTPDGGWLQDEGDPVLAAADGTVAEVDKRDGLVLLNHFNGTERTEYRHMSHILVEPGERVQRGDRLGSIGNVAGDGRSFGAHLHHVHWRRASKGRPWQRVQMRFYGEPVPVSVQSDGKPKGWKAPDPVMVVGPAPRPTWEGAYRTAAKRLRRAEAKVAECIVARGAAESLHAEEVAAHTLTRQQLAACEERAPEDCDGLRAERDGALERARIEQERANEEADRATALEERLARIREIAA